MLLMKMMYYNYLEIFLKTKKLDCLINNVGVAGPTGTIEKLSSKDWEKTIKINVISHFYFTKLAIPMLKKIKEDQLLICPQEQVLWVFL